MAHTRCLAGLILLALAVAVSADIRLQNVDRKISLQSQFARITESIKVKNSGTAAEKAVVLCQYVRPGATIAFYKVTDDAKAELKATPTTVAGAPAGVSCFSVALTSAINAGDVASLTVTAVLSTAQTAYPAEITQLDNQLMVYTDNVYVVSPYQVSAQMTEVVMPGEVKSYTDTEKPVSRTGEKVKYGKYDLIKPFTMTELKVHFGNPKPFKHAITLVKEIELSHWGNIYVEEKYELKNAGAKHTGAFSRLKYAHGYQGKANSFRDLRARLPATAHSLYYVDLIGNISTSNTRKTLSETVIDFDARYPLMGGWKVDFTLGYSVPLKGSLFRKRSDGKRRLTMDISTPLDDVFVEDLIVRVVLPEGARAIATDLPFDMEQSFDTKFTYLDTTGRPVVVLHKKNVVPEHASKFSVDYSFSSTSLLHEPTLLVSGFFCLLFAVIVYNRLEFTLTRDDKWKEGQAREKLATFMEQLQAVLQDQAEAIGRLAKAAAALHDAEGTEAANKERAAVDKRIKDAEADKVAPLMAEVEKASPRVAGQVRDLIAKVGGLRDKAVRLLADKVELVKKGTTPLETERKLASAKAVLAEARRDVDAAIDNVFADY